MAAEKSVAIFAWFARPLELSPTETSSRYSTMESSRILALQRCRGLGDETNFGNVHLLDNVEHADYVLVICVV